jgi:hypothetical protein
MARLPRLFIQDCPQYLIQRENSHQAIFFSDEDDTVYLVKFKDFSERFEVLESIGSDRLIFHRIVLLRLWINDHD